jgi:metal-sulfur cluster biosynthetic enzyme
LRLTGTLIEYAVSHVRGREGTFGVVDLGGIRIVGLIKAQTLRVGMTLKMSACGLLEDGSPYYEFEPKETRG